MELVDGSVGVGESPSDERAFFDGVGSFRMLTSGNVPKKALTFQQRQVQRGTRRGDPCTIAEKLAGVFFPGVTQLSPEGYDLIKDTPHIVDSGAIQSGPKGEVVCRLHPLPPGCAPTFHGRKASKWVILHSGFKSRKSGTPNPGSRRERG